MKPGQLSGDNKIETILDFERDSQDVELGVCGDIADISQASVCRVCSEVSEKLAQHFPKFVTFPDDAIGLNTLKSQFYEVASFPEVIGCIDGTHIEIKSPGGSNAELYRNRKGWMALNVQAVSGPNLKFTDVVIRWPGSAHDSRMFNSSSLCMRLENGRLSGLLLGDSAYAQNRYMYTPINNPVTGAEQRYNNAYILTRNVVFGVWKSRFRCLAKCLQTSLRHTTRIIAATAVLHNIAIDTNQKIDENISMEKTERFPYPEAPGMRGRVIRAAFILRHFTRPTD
ncbi:putative nuclease HARBI1 [Dendroctonus ponderosae]|uniref:putative nuclease HARBI1 n=1 Tax=Dendroctonus ponderosae TaxID=77166 RepID=UPI002035F927|nr:putative nuclease HARBI1 [Dendroctonus ponderosae]